MSEQAETVEQEKLSEHKQAQAATDGERQPNLEALMHIPLEISVELGRVNMPLHTIVRMGRGTVFKLNKEAESRVEILANGAVFAYGEVVKADGKLGVRITEIVPPSERIRALA